MHITVFHSEVDCQVNHTICKDWPLEFRIFPSTGRNLKRVSFKRGVNCKASNWQKKNRNFNF